MRRILQRLWLRFLVTLHRTGRRGDRASVDRLTAQANTSRQKHRSLRQGIDSQKVEITGLLQAVRDYEELVADLREQLSQVRAELEGADLRVRTLEGEKSIHEIQLRTMLAGEETILSWLRTQKSLFESESAGAARSARGQEFE